MLNYTNTITTDKAWLTKTAHTQNEILYMHSIHFSAFLYLPLSWVSEVDLNNFPYTAQQSSSNKHVLSLKLLKFIITCKFSRMLVAMEVP